MTEYCRDESLIRWWSVEIGLWRTCELVREQLSMLAFEFDERRVWY